MEPDRVEMSVGTGMVNGDHHHLNGVAANKSSNNTKPQVDAAVASQSSNGTSAPYTNGDLVSTTKDVSSNGPATGSILHDAPPELQQILSSEFYLPMARLISRSAQSCWNDLLSLVEKLASMPVPPQSTASGIPSINDQSKTNLDKKDLLLNFAKDHKDVFIKLLVLLQWSKRSEEVRKTIELNLWLQQRRQAFNNATGMLGAMLRGLADSQVPNPDLYTASEVLATGNVASMPKLDYIPHPTLTPKDTLRILRRLDTLLCTRMALSEDIPSQLRTYNIHDGRVTFTIKDEFSFDVSIASEEAEAKFGMVDFSFLFLPSPTIPDGLHDEISYLANAALDKDGFKGVYDFLHELTLSYKISELTKQARLLSQGLWNGHLKVEVLRRTLVVQYWLKSPLPKSWLEIGAHSGKGQAGATSPRVPDLSLRWYREGKLVDSDDIEIASHELSMENLLRQAMAQHTNNVFEAVYDKLLASPLYQDAELELNQSASMLEPAECFLHVQLSKMDTLHISMEAIAGTLILSPVSDRIGRLQFDLARSKNIVADVISRIPGLRSSTAELNLAKALPNSEWQRLEGMKISPSEAEKLFGQVTSRVNFIRLQQWTQEWIIAITQTASGDLWWLTQGTQPNSVVGSRTTKIVDNHPLYLIGSPSPAYLERLADYTTGVVALQCNAEFLRKNKFSWRLPDIPTFDEDNQLPVLQFSRTASSNSSSSGMEFMQSHRKITKSSSDSMSSISLTYHGIERTSKKVIMVARTSLVADPTVLKDLASSKLDRSVAILPEKQQLMIRAECDPGTPVVENLVLKMSHLENIVACAAAVKKSTEHTLLSLSLSAITILYHKQPDLGLRIDFGEQADDLSASFMPAASNPQRYLSQWVVKSMKKRNGDSSRNLSNIFIVLRMTQPLLSYLQTIQTPTTSQANDASDTDNHLRVHVLNRQPTAYGLHYFSDSTNFAHDDIDPGTPKKLLARFEILAMKRGEKLLWMIRPAIEEFHAYNRPSYTSKTLRERLNREIFKKQSSLWLALDGGAACPSDKPEQLISAIHDTIMDWAKDALKPEMKIEKIASSNNVTNVPVAATDGANDKKPVRPALTAQKSQNQQQRPNGVQSSRPQHQTNQPRPQSFNNKTQNQNQGSRPTEFITID